MTPEGRVKKKIKEILDDRKPWLKDFWPVLNGMGAATIDCHVCYFGRYIAIEAKAPGEVATVRQADTLKEYDDAEANTLVIDGTNYETLIAVLDTIQARCP